MTEQLYHEKYVHDNDVKGSQVKHGIFSSLKGSVPIKYIKALFKDWGQFCNPDGIKSSL